MAEIVILGDICPRWGNAQQFDTQEPQAVFHNILPVLEQADFVVANMEAPITESAVSLKKTSMNLKAKPQDLVLLKKAGIQALSLANNHILDFCTEGLRDTFANLQKENISYFGAGSVKEAAKPLFVEIKGKKIGFLSFAEQEFNCAVDYEIGANLWNDIDSLVQIREAKANCDYLIVMYHGGIEEYIYPSAILQQKCRAMATMGADLITCQHSHCIGTSEEYAGAQILYGQGNSVFGFNRGNEQWNTGLLLRIDLSSTTPKVEYLPIVEKEDGKYLMEQEEAQKLLQTVEQESQKILDNSFITARWKDFCLAQKDMYLPLLLGWGRIANKLNRTSKGKLVSVFLKQAQRRAVMNLVRCVSHREVVQTILEEETEL